MSALPQGGVPPEQARKVARAREALFGKVLIRKGILSAEEVRKAIRAQHRFREQGENLRLGEVLVKIGLLEPEQVRHLLALVGKRLMHCPRCGRNFNVKHGEPDHEVECPRCRVPLVHPPDAKSLNAHATQILPAVQLDPGDARDRSGKPFGRYRLLQELGRGGMGVVWKAWDTQLKRVVALKQVLSGGSVSPEQIQRFMQEARLAAHLRHPNIIAVHDIGVHNREHFFTSEYVEGQPLDRRMKKPISLRQAVEWVKTVAGALAYAHKQGVVHRDIKPGNILIDTRGEPHVMDFGLAKEVDVGSGSAKRSPDLTVSGALLGTPRYMSPEQAAGRTREIGPATDQFALGVVLYELLTHRSPFTGRNLRELLNAVAEQDPTPPSQIIRSVHGDVETICLKAMEKDPSRRYASMEVLERDLGCYLQGDSISARPISRAEQMWRNVRRNTKVVVPTAAAALLLVCFSVWLLLSARAEQERVRQSLSDAAGFEKRGEIEKARDAFKMARELDPSSETAREGFERTDGRLRESRAASEARGTQAAATAKAQEEAFALLEAGRPVLDQAFHYLYSRDARYDELVRRVQVGQAQIEEAIAKAPRLAPAHYLLGRAWELRGWNDKAEACWRKAIELDPRLGPAHYQLGRLLMTRSYLFAVATNENERREKRKGAVALAAEAAREIEAAAKGSGLDDPLQRDLAAAMVLLAKEDWKALLEKTAEGVRKYGDADGVEEFHWLSAIGKTPDQEILAYDRALAKRPKYPLALFCRGTARMGLGDAAGAIADFDEALRISPRMVDALHNRGNLRVDAGDLKAALADYDAALKIDPDMADTLSARGSARWQLGQYPQALADLDRALLLNPRGTAAYHNRGLVRQSLKDMDGALSDFTSALKLEPRALPPRINRAVCLDEMGKYDEALDDLDLVLSIDPSSVEARFNRGIVRTKKGSLEGAREDFETVLRLDPHHVLAQRNLEGLRLEMSPGTAAGSSPGAGGAEACFVRGTALLKSRDLKGAIREFDAALRIDPRHADALANRGAALSEAGDLDGALADLTRAAEMKPGQAIILHNLGTVRRRKGDLSGALRNLDEAVKADPRNAWALHDRGLVRQDLRDLEGAFADYTEAMRLDPARAESANNRGVIQEEWGKFDAAFADFEEAVKRRPAYAEAIFSRGRIRFRKNDYTGAILDYDQAIKIDAKQAKYFVNRGLAHRLKGDLTPARADLDEAVRLSPRFPEAWVNRSSIREEQGDLAGAVEDLTKALECAPPDWPFRASTERDLAETKKRAGQ